MTMEKRKAEAIARMVMLNLAPKAIEAFRADGTLHLSVDGILTLLDDAQKEKVHSFETENDCLVYHAIHNDTSFGKMLTLLYVSKYSDEWKQDQTDIKAGFPLAYVINLDEDAFSEFGAVGVESHNGGLIRTE